MASRKELFDFPGSKSRSIAWKHFGFQKQSDGPVSKSTLDMTRAICRHCFKSYAFNGNTTTLIFHLDNEHRDINKDGLGAKAKSAKAGGQHLLKSGPVSTQITLTSQWKNQNERRNLSNDKKERITRRLTDLAIETFLPFSTLEHPSFKAYTNELEDRYIVPGRKAVLNNIHKLYGTVKDVLYKDLIETPYVAITHDAWTSINVQSYDTITVHYISEDWVLKSAVLRTQLFSGSHTGENIAYNLKETAELWKLRNITAVTDNAANEKKAFEILGWPRVGCYGHRINLVVKTGLAVPDIAKLIAKGRNVVTHFHSSSIANEVLEKKQKLLLPESAQGHKLIQDVCTRWNSTLDMLCRLAEQTPALHAVVLDPVLGKKGAELRFKLFSLEEQSLVEALIKVLHPFKIATEMLSAEKTPTQHLVLAILKKLQMALAELDNDLGPIKKMKHAMKISLEARTQDKDIALVASLLSPSTKLLNFVPSEEREKAKALLKQEMLENLHTLSVKKEPKIEDTQTEVPQPALATEGPQPALPELPNLPNLPALPQLPHLPNLPDVEYVEDVPKRTNPSPSHPENTKKRAKLEEGESEDSNLQQVTSDSDDWLSDVICCGSEPGNIISRELIALQEFDRYSVEPPSSLPPLNWWKENQIFFPIISRIARKYLAIPASSVASERIFSMAGNLVNKKRSQLKPENVDVMIFLNKNKGNYLKAFD